MIWRDDKNLEQLNRGCPVGYSIFLVFTPSVEKTILRWIWMKVENDGAYSQDRSNACVGGVYECS
jgi:hypothetical protein